MDRSICRALNLDKILSVEVVLRICQWQKHFDGSRSCRQFIDQTESCPMDREAIENLLRRNLEISMDRDCNNFYQEKKKEELDRNESIEDLSRSRRA